MSNIDKQALREEFRYMQDHYSDPADRARQVIYIAAEALLDELDKKQQYIKLRDQENEDIALTVGKLRVELEHYKSREERVTKLVLDNSTSWDVLYEKLEAAEKRIAEQREYYEGVIADGSKRIAELESNEVREVRNQFLVVRHPGKTPAIKHCTGDLEEFLRKLIEQDPLVTIDIITHRYYGVGGQWVQDAGEYLQMMQGAGIGVKHQEDSVDSDVSSRNQPGMVVAVHIDAGDFVKVKGQVFEVEETDFDDHDVTLWFVGGNTLKCAAGCPVEVVSAPVAAGIKVKGSEHDRSTKR
ncbi:ead/Ea22-like family protein [Salmonella enterica]|nr:ead/Ea22-like family protein [Salmonella enterica]EFU2167730.1 ead/Ea22-like family protein [Salmonella enterica]EHX0365828.1 ead/Ea22-like family protein [Salmonella enterica]ELR1622349.1 ead/Ea22-like family protein [Salmonella enterica]